MKTITGERQKATPPSRKKQGNRPLLFLITLAAVVSVILLQLYKYKEHLGPGEVQDNQSALSTSPPPTEGRDKQQSDTAAIIAAPMSQAVNSTGSLSLNVSDSASLATDDAEGEQSSTLYSVEEGAYGLINGEPADISSPDKQVGETPEAGAAREVTAFFTHLDKQPYLKQFNKTESSQTYVLSMVRKILAHSPVVSGETRDLFTILKNTAHFFRVLGRENTFAFRAIINNESDRAEMLLSRLYILASSPSALKDNFDISLNDEVLYDYAGFFMSTMGGRLYLFRRTVNLRLLVSYYSILILYDADRQGMNRHGIDLRQLLDTFITELENNGSLLKGKDHYLDKLYTMRENYL